MSVWALVLTIVKLFTAFWSLVTLAVSAAFIGQYNTYLHEYGYTGSGFGSGNATLASAIICFVYFVAICVFLFLFPESILISVMLDTICLGFLWILVLGSVAALSVHADYLQACDLTVCQLGSGTIGLGWVLWFLIFFLLAFEVTYTLVHYGPSYPTWRTPMAQLLVYGSPKSTDTGVGRFVENGPTVTPFQAAPGTATPAAAHAPTTESVPMTNVQHSPATTATGYTNFAPAPSITTTGALTPPPAAASDVAPAQAHVPMEAPASSQAHAAVPAEAGSVDNSVPPTYSAEMGVN